MMGHKSGQCRSRHSGDVSMGKLYAAGVMAASVMALTGCGASAVASSAVTPSGAPEEAPDEGGIPSPLKSKLKTLLPEHRTPGPSESPGGAACATLASPQARSAADAITIPKTPDEAQTELQQLAQMGLYRPDVVAYSSNPIDAVKQLKERLEYGLIG